MVLINEQFSFAALPAIFVSCTCYFLVVPCSVSFSWQPSFRNVEGNFHRLFLPSFSHFSIANFKHCWVISPFSPAFHTLRTPITRSFLSHLPNPSQWSHPLILPSSSPLSTSTKFFVHLRPACTVNPLLLRSPLRSLNIIIKRLRKWPLSRQKCA